MFSCNAHADGQRSQVSGPGGEYLTNGEIVSYLNHAHAVLSFCRDCAFNWDCDTDGHKYNTGCRCCKAAELLSRTF